MRVLNNLPVSLPVRSETRSVSDVFVIFSPNLSKTVENYNSVFIVTCQ